MLASWRRTDKERANASGGGEVFGEYEQLIEDMRKEVDDLKAMRESAKLEAKAKEDGLLAAGKAIRNSAMNRRPASLSAASEAVGTVEEGQSGQGSGNTGENNSTPSSAKKAKRLDRGEMERAIVALDNAEEDRTVLAKRCDERDTTRLDLEQRQFEMAVKSADERSDIERRRLALDEQRHDAEQQRAKEQAAEKKLNLEIQKEMLGMLRDIRK